jgi:hypothetical protein
LLLTFVPLTNAHLEDLLSHRNFTLEVNFYVCEIQAAIVARLDAIESLFMQQAFDLIFVELCGFGKLLAHLLDELVVNQQLLVVFLQLFKLSLGALLI